MKDIGQMDLKKTFNEMSILSPLLILYTIVYLGLMVYDFAARGAFELPAGMMVVYIALPALNVSDSTAGRLLAEMEAKKLIRQVGEHKGTYYVAVGEG